MDSNLIQKIDLNDSLPVVTEKQIFTIPSFYMKNSEVTNAEYREFTRYILDSLRIRQCVLMTEDLSELQKGLDLNVGRDIMLNRIDYFNIPKSFRKLDRRTYHKMMDSLWYPESQRFYGRREIKKSNYQYNFQGTSLNVYPDTLAGVHESDGISF